MQQELEHIAKFKRLISEIKGFELENDLIAEYGDQGEDNSIGIREGKAFLSTGIVCDI